MSAAAGNSVGTLPGRGLTPAFSLYLDAARVVAAICVVFDHFLSSEVLPAGLRSWVPDIGREAVMVFFVLSGYLIASSTARGGATLSDFLVARSARIYSVALPLLLLAFLIDGIAIQFHPDAYPHLYQYRDFHLYIPLHLAFLGEAWTLAERPASIGPYWSLSFEFWYYLLFAACHFYRGRQRCLLIGAIFLVVGYEHAILLPVWASGVLLFHCRTQKHWPDWLARGGFFASFVLLTLTKLTGLDITLWHLGREVWPWPSLPQGSADQFLYDYWTALLVLLNFHCARQLRFDALLRIGTAVRGLSGYTYTLYLVHMLVLHTWVRNWPYDNTPGEFLGLCSAIALATYVIGTVTEQRRSTYTVFFRWLFARCVAALRRLPRLARWLTPLRP